MTEKDFRFNIEVKKEMELQFRNTKYFVNYGIDNSGKNYIGFGEQNLPPQKYYSYSQFVNEAYLGVCPLRYSIEGLILLNS